MRATHCALRVAVTDQMGVWVKRGAGSEVTGQDRWPWSTGVMVESRTTRPVASMGNRPDRESSASAWRPSASLQAPFLPWRG